MIKNGKYLVSPTTEGSIIIYKWGQFQQYKDRLKGTSESIFAMAKMNEDTVFTGSEDGFVRGVGFYPNKMLQVIGQHE